MNDDIYSFKIVVAGQSGAGKTYFCNTIIGNNGIHINEGITIGVEYFCNNITIKDTKYKINLWDLGGHSSFSVITDSYIRGTIGCIIMLDLHDPYCLQKISGWWDRIKNRVTTSLPEILIICNKTDLVSNDYVSKIVNSPILCQIQKESSATIIQGSLKSNQGFIINKYYEFIEKIKNRSDLACLPDFKVLNFSNAYKNLSTSSSPRSNASIGKLKHVPCYRSFCCCL